MRYPNSLASYGYYSLLFYRLTVILDNRSKGFNSLGHPNIGQAYQSCMREPL